MAQQEQKYSSCTGLRRVAGELVATPFRTAGSTKRPYDKPPAFDGSTTNVVAQRLVRAAADSMDVHRKRLMRYSCWAPRNRPHSAMTNKIGCRVAPAARAAAEGGRLTLGDADPESRRPWRTTNQVFQACTQVSGVVGLANSGIASDVAARLHKTQGIYN